MSSCSSCAGCGPTEDPTLVQQGSSIQAFQTLLEASRDSKAPEAHHPILDLTRALAGPTHTVTTCLLNLRSQASSDDQYLSLLQAMAKRGIQGPVCAWFVESAGGTLEATDLALTTWDKDVVSSVNDRIALHTLFHPGAPKLDPLSS